MTSLLGPPRAKAFRASYNLSPARFNPEERFILRRNRANSAVVRSITAVTLDAISDRG
jgi:hypothetical protein